MQRRQWTACFGAITDALKDGDEVRLVGFGTFSVAERAPRKAAIRAPARPSISLHREQPKFRAGKGLKDALN